MQGMLVRSQVGELRFHMSHDSAKKEKKKKSPTIQASALLLLLPHQSPRWPAPLPVWSWGLSLDHTSSGMPSPFHPTRSALWVFMGSPTFCGSFVTTEHTGWNVSSDRL